MTHRTLPVAERFARMPLFAGSSKRELDSLARLTVELDVEAGKALTSEGELGREFLIVLSGEAVALHGGRQVATFGPGDCFGEVAVLDHSARTATVVARTPMHLAVVAAQDFDRLIEQVPALAHKVLQVMAHRLAGPGGAVAHPVGA
ncbi:MAG TPA: cyclic nucleotide-binding domain-containing protein [Jatrophihabitantaceae bacterium]|nr:cyclic nucleotide-binding domain-containing protein [Jatrophihabitantaceae bacterium]